MKKTIANVLMTGLVVVAAKADATTYQWELGFFNTEGEVVGNGHFSYDDSTFDDYYLYDVIDYDAEPYGGRYFPRVSTDGLRVNSAVSQLDVAMNLPGGKFVSTTDLRGAESQNWWEGDRTEFSLDYVYEDTQGNDVWFDDEETVEETVWWTDRVGPGSVFDVGYGYFTEAYENPDQWVINSDYELSEVAEDLIMHQFEKLEDGVWMGVWQMGYRHDFTWYGYSDDRSENDGYWTASLESVTVSAVPIPAALPLFMAGIGFLGFSLRKREKQM